MNRFLGRDGVELSYREVGDGRPLVLLHGFIGSGAQWIDPGPATILAERGHRVILPDLRGHGDSARPHDPARYPPDVLADDGLALLDALDLDDYDLGGYSLGGRIVLRMLVRGARPARAIVAGQGLDAISRATSRTGGYRRLLTAIANGETFEPGSADAQMTHWITESGNDPHALTLVLDTHVATPEAALHEIRTPTLVVIGADDDTHSTADALAATLPNAQFARVPGNHYTAMSELADVFTKFLTPNGTASPTPPSAPTSTPPA